MHTTAATPTSLPAIPADVRVKILPNGLTIIVREDHSAPVVSAQAWCKSGAIHEDHLLGAGMSHALEHMLFKGTENRKGSRIDQEVQEAGGYMNAYTSFDRTVYWIDVPNTGAETAIDILCDIMQHATLPADELTKEKQVILREMDMNQDDPGRRAGRRLFEVAYTTSPYRYTIIGYPDIFNELSREDLFHYYKSKYVPNNVFFVVVGDIKADDAIAQIEKAYEKTGAKALKPVVLPLEPRQMASREIIEEAPIELGHFHVSWHIPELRHADVPLLDILATLLGHGRSSRLFREIREKQGLAHSADAWTYSPGLPGLFGMSAVFDGDKFEAARDAMLAEVEKLKHTLVPAEELAKTVKQFVSATLASRKTMAGQAQDLGSNWISAHDLNFSHRFLEAVKAATPEDIQRVARQYLTTENRTLFALLPTSTTPVTESVDTAHESKPVEKVELPNGLRILLKEDHRLPFVQIRCVFNGGVLAESPANNGITQLMAKTLLQGTTTRGAEQIANEIESVGGSISSYGGNNSFGVNAEVLSDDLATGLGLVADVLLNPIFPADSLERERQIQLAGIRSQKDHLLQNAVKLTRKAMFGEAGYGLDGIGTEASVTSLDLDAIKAFHDRMVAPNNCVLSVYGDVDAAATKALIEQTLGSWARKDVEFETHTPPPAISEIRRTDETRDKTQAVVVIGFQATQFQEEDRYALDLVQEACSDLGSRLFMRIRDELGLAYYVGASHMPGKIPGWFMLYTGTAGDQAEQVEKELLAEAAKLRTDGLTQEELDRARAKVLGSKKISRQDLGHQAMSAALDELYGHGYDYCENEDTRYESVTLEQARAAAAKYLTPDAFAVTVLKPKES